MYSSIRTRAISFVGLVVIYKLLLAAFGMSSPLPFHVASTLVYLLAAVLLFAYARRRVGDWLALMGTIVILFFGAVRGGHAVAVSDLLLRLDRRWDRGAARARSRRPRGRRDRLHAARRVDLFRRGRDSPFAVGVLVPPGPQPAAAGGRLYVVGRAAGPLRASGGSGWGHTTPSYLSLGQRRQRPRCTCSTP